ncbi:Gfo/Idh/MocA family oxidoreductase [Bosea sp. (in: a-proteobacteria)]|uniref:Gfo/Idh/MocA family protein n=1 Tax=Bosea sp. (in: a-proteobacteria) TaxID=1871050 RepID=UPI0025BD9D96|nr:Gfo/Idh/MocA family oxidoreductase [Bosea sp. (in: a-proteobacteria)]MBR3192797.1 Gfo/Idh/MocA family oxidoreductase [Bosea sp. (in: a-proteobacteria)]
MTNIAIGVIGAGLIGRKHLAKIAEHPDFDLVGIADVNAEQVAAGNPGVRVFADYRAMLHEARPSAVIIASPNQLHAENGIECARRGIHILIEKPVTDTLESANALIGEVRAAGIRSLVGHHRRHHRQVATLRSLLNERRIGDLVGVSAIWAVYKPDPYFKAAPWRTQPGGGPVLINLIHEIDFLRFSVGEIASVGAVVSNRQRGFAVEDTAGVLIEFENGAIGTFFVSDSTVSPWTTEQGVGESPEFPFSGESSYRFMGSRGALEFPNLVQWSHGGDAPSWNEPIQARRIHAPTLDPYVAQLDHFRDLILGKAASLQPVEDGARTLIATLAVAEAAATGQRIDLRERCATLLPPQPERKAS